MMQGKLLRAMRNHTGYTREKMGELLNTHHVNVWRWETDKNEIKLSMFVLWCQVCGYDMVVTQQLMVPTRGEEGEHFNKVDDV